MDKKNIFIIGIISVMFMSVIAAAWFFEYDNTINGEVLKRGKELDILVDLSDFQINLSEMSPNNQSLVIDNKKDPRIVTFTIDVNKTLTEPTCPDYENDCTVEFFNETDLITNGTSYMIPKGILNYTLSTSCIEYSCGQNISVRVQIKEL